MYGVLTIGLIIIVFLSVMFLPVFIAKKRGLTSDRMLVVKICTWLSLLTGVTWLVALALSLFLDPNKYAENLSLNTPNDLNENNIEEAPKETKKLGDIPSLLCFALLVFLYGTAYHGMGPWMLIFGICFIFWIFQIKLFYKISFKSKYWTILYSLFTISSVYWILLLDQYHDEGSGAQANDGLYCYLIGSIVLVVFAKFLSKSQLTKILTLLLFLIGGYGITNYYSIKAKFVCPPEKPLMNVYRGCYECSNTKSWGNIGNCSACANRIVWGGQKYCALAQCPSNYPLRNNLTGDCYSCDDPNSLKDVNNCSDCTSRKYNESNHCILATCPMEKPLKDKFGSCYSCENVEALENTINCDTCKNRFLDNGRCILENCPTDFPLKDVYGECHSCDELSVVFVGDKKICNLCKNRKIFGTDEAGTHREFCSLTTCPVGTTREKGFLSGDNTPTMWGRCFKKKY